MNLKRILGLAAVAGLLMMAVPTERAQALSLSNPGVAAAVQGDTGKLTTEVRYYHHYGYHHHYHHYWHHHYHWRHHYGHHHYWHHHHWHHHYWHHHYRHHHYGHRHY